ncbi:restriction endonuclease [Methanothermococcus sp. Ax23]|uniref:restriction endonuclease n=1 Tax=Methanothermococcus sp. Ax23 TaxID=3156486 RepID=UPI003BA0E6FC
MDDDYYNEIELILRQILQPIEKISFSTFIRVISGYKVIPLDLSANKDKKLVDDLIKASNEVIKDIRNTKGIKTKDGETPKRVNEVGNHIEPYVKKALSKYGYATTPKTKNGKHKSTGYPDIEFWYGGKSENEGRVVYIEIKTYNEKNVNSSQRTFYASPPNDKDGFKIIHDAPHIVISFKIEKINNNYYATGFKIVDLYKLTGSIKREFNASNKELYDEELVICSKNYKFDCM